MEQVLSRLSMPYQLLSDQGPEFRNELFLDMCKWMGIDNIRTNPYRPACCNDMFERYHRTKLHISKNHRRREPAELGHEGPVCHGGVSGFSV